MHIAFTGADLPDSGAPTGVVTYIKIMRDSLRELGHQVSVIAGDRLLGPDGTLHQLSRPGRIRRVTTRYYDRLVPHGGIGISGVDTVRWRMLEAHRLVGFETLEMEEAFGTAAAIAAANRFPLVLRLHGPHVFGRDTPDSARAEAQDRRRIADEGHTLMAAAGVTCPSGRLMEATFAHYGLRPPLAAPIPNPQAACPAEQRWSIGSCDPKQLLCVGRFDLRKGADVVLAAFAIAAAADPALHLVLAGPDRGMREGGRMVHFEEYARTHLPEPIRARVRFLGPVRPDEVRRLRRESGLAIVASRFENFAYSVVESLSVGAPTIVSDSFGNGEIVEHGRSGLVVPVGDPAALAEAIMTLTATPDRLAAMGLAAWERCRSWLSPERIAAETLIFHQQAAERWRGAAH